MQNTNQVFRKEFKAYFISPIAYIVMAIFLLACGLAVAGNMPRTNSSVWARKFARNGLMKAVAASPVGHCTPVSKESTPTTADIRPGMRPAASTLTGAPIAPQKVLHEVRKYLDEKE